MNFRVRWGEGGEAAGRTSRKIHTGVGPLGRCSERLRSVSLGDNARLASDFGVDIRLFDFFRILYQYLRVRLIVIESMPSHSSLFALCSQDLPLLKSPDLVNWTVDVGILTEARYGKRIIEDYCAQNKSPYSRSLDARTSPMTTILPDFSSTQRVSEAAVRSLMRFRFWATESLKCYIKGGSENVLDRYVKTPRLENYLSSSN